MRSVKSKDTAPELIVRRATRRLGRGYCLHRSDLPGAPDLVFPGRHKVIFVHGCFWHQHDCPRGARLPKANREYWQSKLHRNQERDALHYTRLHALGWDVLVICVAFATEHFHKFKDLLTGKVGAEPVPKPGQ